MDIHKLYIFAKNRDAIAAQKGYSYQQLRTIQDWLKNRTEGRDEAIYCDYEDDIFTRDVAKGTSAFKQLKLYSTDFSFSSDSITKSISHFFMLYVKGDYAFDKVSFTFETNVAVVERNVKNNDADLLREWYANQSNLSDELGGRIRVRVKSILDEYINQRFEELTGSVELKGEVQKAKMIYDSLKDYDVDAFIRCITWQFDNISQDHAVDQVVTDIKSLVMQVPLPLEPGRAEIYTALLIAEVHKRSIQDNPDERKLTNAILDSILLKAGGKDDQWYAEAVDQSRKSAPVARYYPGEFLQAATAARYCRWENLDESHKTVWQTKLLEYLALEETTPESKRKAIYEYIFLKIGGKPWERPVPPATAADVDLIKSYIENWTKRNHIREIEDDITFLQLLSAQKAEYAPAMTKEYLAAWEKEIETFLNAELSTEKNMDRLCELLELRGYLEQEKNLGKPGANVDSAFAIYRNILPYLELTSFYSLSTLYDKMNALLDLLVKLDVNEALQDAIEGFKKQIQAHVNPAEKRTTDAFALMRRAELHLEHRTLRNNLKALDLFHEAKDILRMEDTKGPYVVCLLGVSGVYSALGMTYASKHYALIALWSTWHSGNPRLNRLLPNAIGQVNFTDFISGAWMHAIHSFGLYLLLQREFDERGFAFHADALYFGTRHNIARIMHAIPLIHPDMNNVVEGLKKMWGQIWTEQVQPFIDLIAKESDPLANLAGRLNDTPLNDVGDKRTIHFNALKVDWIVSFENNEIMTALGEEFLSFLQVMLCEITRENPDVLVPGQQVNIAIEEGHFQKEHLGNGQWRLTIPAFDSNDEKTVNNHYVYLGALTKAVLGTIAVKKADFDDLYIKLLSEKGFAQKAVEGTAYQRAFKQSVDTSPLDVVSGSDFAAVPVQNVITVHKKWLVEISG